MPYIAVYEQYNYQDSDGATVRELSFEYPKVCFKFANDQERTAAIEDARIVVQGTRIRNRQDDIRQGATGPRNEYPLVELNVVEVL